MTVVAKNKLSTVVKGIGVARKGSKVAIGTIVGYGGEKRGRII